jgi:hypothetical protein
MQKAFLLILSLSIITSGFLIIRHRRVSEEEGYRGWGTLKGKPAVFIGVLTIMLGLILLIGGLII